ncbi:Eco57I restriction-modification methylase domain-containing protein [Actinoplanes flavus]|uniref:site-specific DNA-methyltransferase (adenine-specific) n=1 Tax=Actinoplanes flavus TaxID=2820290 RepID=A0ABS3UCY8_9ACTN|nr:N-6 DNA methylase [Actinoplanes flavus]MBO3736648.1 N-6 DNA methylase [Actinoplanes flavus]
MQPGATTEQLSLDLLDQRQIDIAAIHQATGIYTATPEIEALLDQLDWPAQGCRLLDPGAGNGGFLVAALRRLDLDVNDVEEATRRVHGYEFYREAVADARRAVSAHLCERGWTSPAAWRAANEIVEDHDFLLSPVPTGIWDVIAANPPYWRLANLPAGYRIDYEAIVPAHARADLLYAYLDRSADVITRDGHIGLITADRWLLNSGSGELRRRLGTRYSVAGVHRLDAESTFYRPKTRRRGTVARVHPVSLILTPSRSGRPLGTEPFWLTPLPAVDGVPLRDIAEIRLAPWLGPDGIFIVGPDSGLPAEHLMPVVEPADIDGEAVRPARKWALATDTTEPPRAVLAHLDATLHRMPKRGRRAVRWLPPETFTGRLPLDRDAVLVPRIARRLTGIRLPAGRLPINHGLVVISGLPVESVLAMLDDPQVQAQANDLSLGIDNGYRSFTATLLRQLVIPRRHLTGVPGSRA